MHGGIKVAVVSREALLHSWWLHLNKELRLVELIHHDKDLGWIKFREVLIVALVIDHVDLAFLLLGQSTLDGIVFSN